MPDPDKTKDLSYMWKLGQLREFLISQIASHKKFIVRAEVNLHQIDEVLGNLNKGN
jgi:hypothetical protein